MLEWLANLRRSRLFVTVCALGLVATGIALGRLSDRSDVPDRQRVERSDVERIAWESVVGAGAPPRCSPEDRTGIGEWECTVYYRSMSQGPEQLKVRVHHDGSVSARRRSRSAMSSCCIPVED